MKNVLVILSAIIAFVLVSCSNGKSKDKVNTATVMKKDYVKDATIYEVNIRQYTPEGTIKAFEKHLPRLKDLGVDILWIMPINPIGELNRKGDMGSYYSVKNYFEVNPEFGTKEEFRNFVTKAHNMGFKVILDWVANHSAWDNANVTLHPDWYTSDSLGNLVSPFDWSDVVDFNYDNKDMRNHMIKALKYWVKEFDIDGYRCDVAGMVPVDFWENAVHELNKIKPVFMLAEDEGNIDLDEIDWTENRTTAFYKNLTILKKNNKALWTPPYGGTFEILESNNENVLAYKRVKDDNEIIVILNLSDKEQTYRLNNVADEYTVYPSHNKDVVNNKEVTLPAWKYRVLIK